MEQIGKEIEKVIKAGIGAVSCGVEKSAEVLEKLAQKGEPIYEQAKSSLCDTAGKIKKAVDDSNIPENIQMMFGGKVTVSTLTSALKQFTKEELDQVKQAIDDMYADAPDKHACEPAQDGPCDCDEPCTSQVDAATDVEDQSAEEN